MIIEVKQPCFFIDENNPEVVSYDNHTSVLYKFFKIIRHWISAYPAPIDNKRLFLVQTFPFGFPDLKEDEILYRYKENRGVIRNRFGKKSAKEYLQEIQKQLNNPNSNKWTDDIITLGKNFFEDELRKLQSCYEFSNCEITFTNEKKDDEFFIILDENTKLVGKLEIREIGLTCKTYKSMNEYKVKDALLYPIIYDPDDFSPYRKAVIRINVEDLEKEKKRLHNLIDDIFKDSSKYDAPYEQNVFIKGRRI